MRIVLMVGMLLALGFSGCIGDEGFDTDSEADPQAQYKGTDPRTEMPEKRLFEPKVILDTLELEVEQGSNPVLEFYVTDMDDYTFPVTFIDWALFHDRNPNPVAEGDATDLPGTFNQTLYAKGYHMFGFRVDDTQALNETRILIISVGEHEDEYPTEFKIAHFRWRIDSFFGDQGAEPLPPVGEVIENVGGGGAVYEPMTIEKSILVTGSCKAACMNLGGGPYGREVKAVDCLGLQINRNGIGCAWVELPPSAVGATFSITSASAAGVNDPDGVFLDRCAPWAMTIQRLGAEGAESGEVPPGARCMVAWHWADDRGNINFKVEEFQNAISGHIPYDTEPKTEFFTGPSIPCVNDVQGLRVQGFGYGCPGLMAGPYSMFRDGWWIPIDPRYEGAELAVNDFAGSGATDTDCLFLDHMLHVVGSANGGSGPCAGTVPAGAYWLYQFSYTGPAVENKVTFTLDPAVVSAAEEQGMPVGATLMEDYEDLGGVWKHKDTNVCYVKEYTGTNGINGIPGFFYISYGTWAWQETNGIPGLQVSPDDFGAATYAGSPAPDGCTGGDMTVF